MKTKVKLKHMLQRKKITRIPYGPGGSIFARAIAYKYGVTRSSGYLSSLIFLKMMGQGAAIRVTNNIYHSYNSHYHDHYHDIRVLLNLYLRIDELIRNEIIAAKIERRKGTHSEKSFFLTPSWLNGKERLSLMKEIRLLQGNMADFIQNTGNPDQEHRFSSNLLATAEKLKRQLRRMERFHEHTTAYPETVKRLRTLISSSFGHAKPERNTIDFKSLSLHSSNIKPFNKSLPGPGKFRSNHDPLYEGDKTPLFLSFQWTKHASDGFFSGKKIQTHFFRQVNSPGDIYFPFDRLMANNRARLKSSTFSFSSLEPQKYIFTTETHGNDLKRGRQFDKALAVYPKANSEGQPTNKLRSLMHQINNELVKGRILGRGLATSTKTFLKPIGSACNVTMPHTVRRKKESQPTDFDRGSYIPPQDGGELFHANLANGNAGAVGMGGNLFMAGRALKPSINSIQRLTYARPSLVMKPSGADQLLIKRALDVIGKFDGKEYVTRKKDYSRGVVDVMRESYSQLQNSILTGNDLAFATKNMAQKNTDKPGLVLKKPVTGNTYTTLTEKTVSTDAVAQDSRIKTASQIDMIPEKEINRIADNVYKIIAKKISIERERKGFI